MKYNIPKELTTETKITGAIYLKDFFILVGVMFIAYLFEGVVHPSLNFLYYIAVFVLTFFLINRSRDNPLKRNYQSVYLALIQNRTVYHPIDRNDLNQ
jgi:hypothetical protein